MDLEKANENIPQIRMFPNQIHMVKMNKLSHRSLVNLESSA